LQKFSYKTLLLLGLLGLVNSMQAQEFLTGLGKNVHIIKEAQQQKWLAPKDKSESERTPLALPFFDDFSNYTGYPNEKLFRDRQAFVNQTFPVRPPTMGVVTLDALNEYGEIYPHLTTTSRGADTLTSRFIRLDSLFRDGNMQKIKPKDSLYFSFYFQPGGGNVVGSNIWESIGNQPDINDSLVLEFGYLRVLPDTAYTVWDHIWSTPGFNISKWTSENPLHYFKQIMIPITDEKYLCTHFQFRFRNYASLEPQQGIQGWEGNVDQWHIDYIRLDVNRNVNDIYTNDLAFVNPTTSFLKNFQSMPWKQFRPTDVRTDFKNILTNLYINELISTYQYYITHNGNIIADYNAGIPPIAEEVFPYTPHSNSLDSGVYKKFAKIEQKKFSKLNDTATFKVIHIFQNDAGIDHDFCLANDTCIYEQKFDNYYAYDDGTAEYGYCLNNEFNIAYLALKFPLQVSDQLSAVRMWFNHTKNAENKEAQFFIIVWKDKNGQPDSILYTSEVKRPRFEKQFLDFVEYQFDKKIPVSGNIWVGFQQQGNVQLNIGFDQNIDSDLFMLNSNPDSAFFKYNTNGTWKTSVFRGTPMLRPVFGEINHSICCTPTATAKVKPNPAKDWIEITNYELRITSVEIFDMMGRKMKAEGRKQKDENVWEINIAHLPAGIYFVRIFNDNNSFQTVKLIKN